VRDLLPPAGPPAPVEPVPESPGGAPAIESSALLVLAAALLILAVAIVAYTLGARSATSRVVESQPVPAEPSAPREPAPPFTLPSLRGQERISLAGFRGQTVVINFFASWCRPCELEAADLQRAWQKVEGHEVMFLGVAVQDRYRDAQAFLTKHGITYPAAFDDGGDVMQAYRITGIPTTVFIDPQGRVAGRHTGIFVGEEGVARLLARIEAAHEAPR
jgi:cytochrome c biogenesis protein CcmG/thiol:disulfide interchange protein DsbE